MDNKKKLIAGFLIVAAGMAATLLWRGGGVNATKRETEMGDSATFQVMILEGDGELRHVCVATAFAREKSAFWFATTASCVQLFQAHGREIHIANQNLPEKRFYTADVVAVGDVAAGDDFAVLRVADLGENQDAVRLMPLASGGSHGK